MAIARLVARRNGRPDPGLRNDPCGDHGVRRGVYGHPGVPDPGGWLGGMALIAPDDNGVYRRLYRVVCGHDCRGPERCQAGAGLFHDFPVGLYGRSHGDWRVCRGGIPPDDPCLFQGALVPGVRSVIHGMEHGVLHTGDDVDPQDMFNMGGLRQKMPITFWTFLIGGFALSGFPLVTAGFWSKDEILADAFGHNHWVVFGTLALAALLTAFYTMRQITLTFLGEPRTEAAEHAHETPWTMTFPWSSWLSSPSRPDGWGSRMISSASHCARTGSMSLSAAPYRNIPNRRSLVLCPYWYPSGWRWGAVSGLGCLSKY